MHACVYKSMYDCVYVCMCVWLYVCVCICAYDCVYVYACMCVCVCMYVCVYEWYMYVCMNVCIKVYMYVVWLYMYVCMWENLRFPEIFTVFGAEHSCSVLTKQFYWVSSYSGSCSGSHSDSSKQEHNSFILIHPLRLKQPKAARSSVC